MVILLWKARTLSSTQLDCHIHRRPRGTTKRNSYAYKYAGREIHVSQSSVGPDKRENGIYRTASEEHNQVNYTPEFTDRKIGMGYTEAGICQPGWHLDTLQLSPNPFQGLEGFKEGQVEGLNRQKLKHKSHGDGMWQSSFRRFKCILSSSPSRSRLNCLDQEICFDVDLWTVFAQCRNFQPE